MSIFYVSPGGSSLNPGTINSPWTLAHAAAGASGVLQGGDTVLLLSGVYNIPPASPQTFTLSGASNAPILFCPAPNAVPILNGGITISGSNITLYNIRSTWTHDGIRTTNTPGSSPADVPRAATGVSLVLGSNVRLIECMVYDQAGGIFSAKGAANFQIIDSIVFNNGWIGPDRGHGHGFYSQNDGTTRHLMRGNILFDNYSTGIKLGGTSGTELLRFDVWDNCSFNNQLAAYSQHGLDSAFHYQGAGLDKGDTTILRNFFANPHDLTSVAFEVGDGVAGAFPVTVNDNLVYGRTLINMWPSLEMRRNILTDFPALADINIPVGLLRIDNNTPSYVIDQNIYATRQTDSPFGRALIMGATGRTFAQWQSLTTWDDNTTFIDGPLPAPVIRVVPSMYTFGKGHVYVMNPLGAAQVSVNLNSIVPLRGSYAIYHVYDYVTGGPPTVRGIANGNLVALPMTSKTPPTPFGGNPLPTQNNTFGAFVVTPDPLRPYTLNLGI